MKGPTKTFSGHASIVMAKQTTLFCQMYSCMDSEPKRGEGGGGGDSNTCAGTALDLLPGEAWPALPAPECSL